jgi:predicted restriction endonuclease
VKKRYSRQQIKKLYHKKCFFCGESNYDLLDAHRIIEGGKYIDWNILVACANCHRRMHSGEIKVDRKYNSTKGIVVHYWWGDKEFWEPESK